MKFMLIAAAALAAGSVGKAAAEPARPVEVMVLGTWHFANPGQDVHNVASEDVRTDRRQAELEAVADALATFRPTRIMIERESRAPDLADAGFAAFTRAALREERGEAVQIGYRLAHRLGHRQVYAIDEQSAEGEPDYFPFGSVMEWAEANGRRREVDALMQIGADRVSRFNAQQAQRSMAEMLIDTNEPNGFSGGIAPYYGLLALGGTQQQPGANLNAMWYLRNAKIFGKLTSVARPGDRVLVIFGSAHNYWLRHFANETPGYRNVDPLPLLRRAAGR